MRQRTWGEDTDRKERSAEDKGMGNANIKCYDSRKDGIGYVCLEVN